MRIQFAATQLLVLLVITAEFASSQTVRHPDLSTIVTRMEQVQQKNREDCQPYSVTREYRFFENDEPEPNSEVRVEVSFVPPGEKIFRIESATGKDRDAKIVQRILKAETETDSGKSPAAIDRRSYDFEFLGEQAYSGKMVWVIGLKPKRSERNLVEGKALVDQHTYQIHQVEGEMAKTPSWWVKSVHLTIDFAGTSSMWIETNVRAVADIRFFGKHMVTAEALQVRTGSEYALRSRPDGASPSGGRNHLPFAMGSGLIVRP